MKNIWVYDIETYPNCFLAYFFNISTFSWLKFEISDRVNDEEKFIEFLYSGIHNNTLKLIGFNCINFDYPVLHHTVLSRKGNDACSIYKIAKRTIEEEYSAIWDNKTLIPQLDLFKIWHYDNKNKSTSLKWLEFAMRSPDVRDLPYAVGSMLTHEEMDELALYCKHDVAETYKFYLQSLKHIEIRQFYSKLENINLINASEIRMSKEIFSKHLAQHMNMNIWDVKKLRTYRKTVNIKDIIFDYLVFEDPINNKALDIYKNYIWYDTTGMSKAKAKSLAIKFQIPYKNVIREYAEGGLHSFSVDSYRFKSNNDYILIDVDFASYYPHISFRNNLHPEHIPGEVFNKLYEGFYIERQNYPKSDPRNYVLKIILNGSYGLSKDKFSMLYDPKWQLAICINGQLILTLLTEKLFKVIPDSEIIFENTDGAMYKIPRSALNAVNAVVKEVEEITSIPLEVQECEEIIARDVNNYINIIDHNKIKFKGVFEIDRDFHKNHSKRIVAIALANYFINNIDIEYTIKNHLNNTKYDFCENYGIYDFCHGVKMTGSNVLFKREYNENLYKKYGKKQKEELVNSFGYTEICKDLYIRKTVNGMIGNKLLNIFKICLYKSTIIKEEKLSKMNRYYVSNTGSQLIKKLPPLDPKDVAFRNAYKKKYPDEDNTIIDNIDIEVPARETNIEAGYLCTVFNKYQKQDNYNINYDYYINECNKIINLFYVQTK